MPEAIYTVPEGYLTAGQAAGRLGVTAVTLRAMVKRGVIAVLRDERDQRVRLFRIEAVARVMGKLIR